jgi:hypothetical protein
MNDLWIQDTMQKASTSIQSRRITRMRLNVSTLSPNRFSTCSRSSSPTLQLHPSVSVGPSPPPRPNCRDVHVEPTKIQLLSGYPHAPLHAAAYFHPASVTTSSTRHGLPCLTHLGKASSCSCKPWRPVKEKLSKFLHACCLTRVRPRGRHEQRHKQAQVAAVALARGDYMGSHGAGGGRRRSGGD